MTKLTDSIVGSWVIIKDPFSNDYYVIINGHTEVGPFKTAEEAYNYFDKKVPNGN